MNTRRRSLSAGVLSVPGLLASLLVAGPDADAQSVVSSLTPTITGTVSAPAGLPPAPPNPGSAAEPVSCSGQVKVTTTAVRDPTRPPGVVVFIDARRLSCIGQLTGARYVNTGQANLTRLLVPSDVIKTTFAFHRDVRGGFLGARTALLTLSLTYDITTGALTSATGSVGNFP